MYAKATKEHVWQSGTLRALAMVIAMARQHHHTGHQIKHTTFVRDIVGRDYSFAWETCWGTAESPKTNVTWDSQRNRLAPTCSQPSARRAQQHTSICEKNFCKGQLSCIVIIGLFFFFLSITPRITRNGVLPKEKSESFETTTYW